MFSSGWRLRQEFGIGLVNNVFVDQKCNSWYYMKREAFITVYWKRIKAIMVFEFRRFK
jgi:hypothetical protein